MFFVVINHYAPPAGPRFLAASTIFSVALSVGRAGVARVLVVDGSAAPDADLRRGLEAVGADYLHAGRRLGFSEGYNAGLALSDQPWTILCASDVYPSLTFYDYLARFCTTPQAHGAGCLVPQLSFSDLAAQRYSRIRAPVAIPLMTLNCNVFDTAYLRALGGVPAAFDGYYNDVVLAWRMFEDRRPILLLPAKCTHFGSLTVASGASNLVFTADRLKFASAYPALHRHEGLWHLDIGRFSRARRVRMLGRLMRLAPEPIRWRLTNELLRLVLLAAPRACRGGDHGAPVR